MSEQTHHPLDPRAQRQHNAALRTGGAGRLAGLRDAIGGRVAAVRAEAGPAIADLREDLADLAIDVWSDLGQRAADVRDWFADLAEDVREAWAEAAEAHQAELGPAVVTLAQAVTGIADALRASAQQMEDEGTATKGGWLDHLHRLTGDARGRVVLLTPDQLRLAAALVERAFTDGQATEAA